MGFDPGLSASWVTRCRDTSPGRLGPSPMAEKQFRSSWWSQAFVRYRSISYPHGFVGPTGIHKRGTRFSMWFSLQDADVWVSWKNWRINPHDNIRCPRMLIVSFVSPINLNCFHIKKGIRYVFLGKHYRANFMDNRHYLPEIIPLCLARSAKKSPKMDTQWAISSSYWTILVNI